MGTLDKEIRVIAVKGAKGDNGKSSYELAVEEELFSGTLEEWIETFATPENYFTRAEIQRVTQAEYDELVETGQVAPNCYYLIVDDTTAQDFETLQNTVGGLQTTVGQLQTTVGQLQTDLSAIGGRTYTHYIYWNFENTDTNSQGFVCFTIINHDSTPITPTNITVEATVACNGYLLYGMSANATCPIFSLNLTTLEIYYSNNNVLATMTITPTTYGDVVY